MSFINHKFKLLILFCLCIVSLFGCHHSDAVLYQLSNQSYSQMMSYIIHAGDETIVIDGGTAADEEDLVKEIISLSEDGTVDAWFITHYHQDHTGALAKILSENNPMINIEKIYYNFPDYQWVSDYDKDCLNEFETINSALEDFSNKIIVSENMLVSLDNIKVQIIRTFNSSITVNGGNNSSSVYKVTVDNQNILFLGDLGEEGGEELIKYHSDDIKNMDYVQMAHHGQAGVGEDVYKIINPTYCLWPTPDWLWENVDHIYKTDETKSWIKKLGVKENYVANNGTIKITL